MNLRDYTVLIAAERAAIEGAPRTQLSLARAAMLDKSTMVVAVDALEEKGLVERRRDPEDRRAWILVTTDAGRELLAQAEGVVVRRCRRTFASAMHRSRLAFPSIARRVRAPVAAPPGSVPGQPQRAKWCPSV